MKQKKDQQVPRIETADLAGLLNESGTAKRIANIRFDYQRSSLKSATKESRVNSRWDQIVKGIEIAIFLRLKNCKHLQSLLPDSQSSIRGHLLRGI